MRTKAEIEHMIQSRGGTDYATFSGQQEAKIAFILQNRQILFVLPLPDRADKKFQWTNHQMPRKRSVAAVTEAWEQACRSKWRALLLAIKAKFESIDAGIETFDEVFMPHIMTPDGQRFGDVALPAIDKAYLDGGVAVLRLAGPSS